MREPLLADRTYKGSGSDYERKYVYHLRVVGGLSHLSGNAHPYFTITADLDRRPARGGRWSEDSCGCLHDEIESRFPDRFSDLIALHLSDDTGAPAHAEANGWYWLSGALGGLGETYHGASGDNGRSSADCLDVFARHCRISPGDARIVANAIRTIVDGDRMSEPYSPTDALTVARNLWRATVETMRDRWQSEASACIERHSLKVYGDGASVPA